MGLHLDIEELRRRPGVESITVQSEPPNQFRDATKMVVPPDIAEADFQKIVIDYAHERLWRCAHFRKARTKNGGWITPVAADGKGFTDLFLCRERLIFMELKSELGTLSPEQKAWRDALIAAGAEWYCFYPGDWNEIRRVLA